MNRHARVHGKLVEYARGELPANEREEILQHLLGCRRCHDECEILKEALHAIPRVSVPPSGRQPDEYWDAFADRVAMRTSSPARLVDRLEAFLDALAAYLRPRWRPVLAPAAAGALVLTAFGIWLAGSPGRPTGIPGQEEAAVIQAAQREEIDDYFERSRILLIGIANIPSEEGDTLDLSVERNAARSLVHTARYLEQKPIDSRSRELIRELERVLVELANLEEQADVPEVDVIRSGVQQQNLLFKIRMAENRRR